MAGFRSDIRYTRHKLTTLALLPKGERSGDGVFVEESNFHQEPKTIWWVGTGV
jgi:hypothetical protein